MTHIEIAPLVWKDLERHNHREGCDRAITLSHQRNEAGIQAYGRPLRTGDRHDFLKHLAEELDDAAKYARGAIAEGQGHAAQLGRIYSWCLEGLLLVEEMRIHEGEECSHLS